MARKRPKFKSTQKFLPIQEIRDGIITLKDGGYRTVLMVNAINFSLKSADEQAALIGNYQSFLNGLGFPIQIVLQSRTLDLDNYLTSLDQAASNQTNDLLRTQIQEYHGFIKELVTLGEVMGKRFYVVVPYAPGIINDFNPSMS